MSKSKETRLSKVLAGRTPIGIWVDDLSDEDKKFVMQVREKIREGKGSAAPTAKNLIKELGLTVGVGTVEKWLRA